MSTTIFLIRHGLTEWTEEDRFTGVSDIPLSKKGIEQANLLSKKFNNSLVTMNAIFSSPLDRCVATAKIIANPLHLIPEMIDDFSELDYGVWEGMKREEITRKYRNEYDRWKTDPYHFSPPKGESGRSLLKRVMPSLLNIVNKNYNNNIIIVAHKAVNRLILCWCLGIPYKYYRERIIQYPACINVLQISKNGKKVVYQANNISHYCDHIFLDTNV